VERKRSKKKGKKGSNVVEKAAGIFLE